MSRVQHLEVQSVEDEMRLDRWFRSHFPGLSHGRLEKMCRKGDIRVDKKRVKAKDRLEAGQMVRVPPLPPEAFIPVQAQDRPKQDRSELTDQEISDVRDMVLHMDDRLIVLNKPAGLPVQGGSGLKNHVDRLLTGLKFDFPEKPRLVHRLDKDTSGVLLLGRDRKAAADLAEAFKKRTTRKIYWALVVGVPRPRQGTISYNLKKIMTPGGEKVVVDRDGQKAVSDFSVVESAGQKTAWLALKPLTGRTHQLRAHCAALETPIVGDGKYGGSEAYLEGIVSKKMHLHAREITVPHPDGGEFHITAPLPKHMMDSWNLLGFSVTEYEDPFISFEDQ
jgi:23S rRNA pseudouridine955/2504/2580 synthase